MLVSLLFLAVGIPIFLYLVLGFKPVHQKIRQTAQAELSALLGADVNIGRLEILPFTRLQLNEISIVERGDTVLSAEALNAGISGRNLLRGRIVITDVELMSPDISLSRDSAGAPLNVAPIFDRLKGDGSNPPSRFNLAVHTLVIRHGAATYDVLSALPRESGFDSDHIALTAINADLTAPKISNNDIRVSLKRLTASEASGLYLRNLAAGISLRDSVLEITGLSVKLNSTVLSFADMEVNLRGRDIAVIELLRGSAVFPADLAPFHPGLASAPTPLNLTTRVELMRDSLIVRSFNLSTPSRALYAATRGGASQHGAEANDLDLRVDGRDLARTIDLFKPLRSNVGNLLEGLGNISFTGSASWSRPLNLSLGGLLSTDAGVIDIDARLADRRLSGVIEANDVDLGLLLPGKELGPTSLGATFDLSPERGHAALSVDHVRWREHDYRSIDLQADFLGRNYAATVEIDDSLLRAELIMTADMTPGAYSATVDGDIAAMAVADMGMLPRFRGHVLSGQIKGAFSGDEPLRLTGELTVNNLRLLDVDGEGLREAPIVLTSDFTSETSQRIRLQSDLVNADVSGQINLRSLVPTVRNLMADALPQYFSPVAVDSVHVNDFTLRATVSDEAPLFSFLNLPARLLYPAGIVAAVGPSQATFSITAPYLSKGNSLISHVALSGCLGRQSWLLAGVTMPSKFGDMDVKLSGDLADGVGNLSVSFDNNASNRYGGEFKLRLKPLYDGLDAGVLPGTLTLGNVDWSIEPAYVGLRNGSAIVHGFSLVRPGQELTIGGVASKFPEDRLVVTLDNINVDYIFQTLQLSETLQFGGDATGVVTASALLSPEPILQTENLYVKGMKYGGCVMGNANIRSRWNNDTRGIELHADVDNPPTNGSTTVDGEIYIVDQRLDFRFGANRTPAAFLHTFMYNWASAIGGTASGHLHLFGDFKNVNLEGDVLAENFALTVGFTDVTYYATDSVHIRPGIIDLSNIIIRDKTGRTGVLNGRLTHECFKDARFQFNISELDRMLVLDTRPTPDNDRWYGTVRANGSAEISGVPGIVNIRAAASTAAGSDFTFALTNAESAAEYTFLTFRDATPASAGATIAALPGSPELDKQMRARVAKAAELAESSNFNFDLQVDVTPEARMNLIMDPNAGDKITGTGTGHVGLLYGSANDEMRLYGDYRIEKGEYNFSLQDIILKTFSIREGSEIAFHGDPMDARLAISAVYQVNANLSDLDESFLNDKEVQRTNVPVYAVLNVDGPMQDPQISFDLDFPTLTSDVKRKVKSIVSTDEMMNRQIIYLLALNRFYTPEYMAATKGNDLMSVASGTLSSQLSNILGQLSDKISVAPSVRTESGDFSDVEFDVALSSTLLNNRLLLNGNFGYRDKTLNNNQFIGDFDVEYLLTRRGNWRLKAYNHFNDRNLYVKTALTTQGIGLVFKHDFDRIFKKSPGRR